ncbi:hypothetical protein [Nannocystis pusilla]|uniref:hypothetical protein n=1 Tax=Nannocystis pusilla TaxID=889268 RepID=UPI003B7E7B25
MSAVVGPTPVLSLVVVVVLVLVVGAVSPMPVVVVVLVLVEGLPVEGSSEASPVVAAGSTPPHPLASNSGPKKVENNLNTRIFARSIPRGHKRRKRLYVARAFTRGPVRETQ